MPLGKWIIYFPFYLAFHLFTLLDYCIMHLLMESGNLIGKRFEKSFQVADFCRWRGDLVVFSTLNSSPCFLFSFVSFYYFLNVAPSHYYSHMQRFKDKWICLNLKPRHVIIVDAFPCLNSNNVVLWWFILLLLAVDKFIIQGITQVLLVFTWIC